MSRNRFVLDERLMEVAAIKGKKKKRQRWSLETSCWAPRKLWGLSRDFFETSEALRSLFMADWDVAVRSHELGITIVKCQRDPSSWRDIDRNGTHDEVDEVREALWANARHIYAAHEYYSALYSDHETVTGEPDVYNMTLNAYMSWVEQCRVISKRLPHGEFETIWSIVNADDRQTKAEDKFNDRKTLNRQEFLQTLVRCAITCYVKRGTIGDVSDAVQMFMSNNMVSNLPPLCLQNSNAFRKRFCYQERPSKVLEANMASIRSLYAAYAEVSQQMNDALRNDELMSIGEWLTFVSHVGLCEGSQAGMSGGMGAAGDQATRMGRQLTVAQAKYIFLWSRIRSACDLSEASEMKLRHLSPTDFLEALVRMSIMVALPTDMEIEEAGAQDAGEFLLAMQATQPREYLLFLATHRPKHTDPDGSDYEDHALQPAERCIHHLVKLLVRTVEHNTSNTAARDEAAADGTVEGHEAAKFLKRRSKGVALQRFEANASLGDVDFASAVENAAVKKLLIGAALKIQMAMRLKKARKTIAERRRAKQEQEQERRLGAATGEAPPLQ